MNIQFPRAVILFDLALCLLFAVPGLSGAVLALLDQINGALGFAGLVPQVEGPAHFFVNFGGWLGVLFNWALFLSRDKRLHWVNIVGRGGVVVLILYHMAANMLPPIFCAFIITETLGAVLARISQSY